MSPSATISSMVQRTSGTAAHSGARTWTSRSRDIRWPLYVISSANSSMPASTTPVCRAASN